MNGQLVRELRIQRAWTIEDLAKRVGIDTSHLSRIERGERPKPSERVAIRIARELGVGTDEITASEPEGDAA
ncbi:helix-turn-helix transcriptional regulator [Nocardiopsis dassonvillei]|uniref:helix-turn-helix domain-containing protein n=1 Tax=Nocardiopsis dassonvillei TaxID=2014 RepID=UPI0020A3DBEA|nr:helix-turn-helix transcriptional regulator [Nocardiopsis dassonvillei]MCP3017254.1 helix-turn-helix transcriptional regulator [Nocardiopsis dassonvillei]